MRRGLMKWEPAELPKAVLTARTERMQSALAAAGFDALVIYTNNVRPAAVTYLTAFTPYWSDAILLLPRQGLSVFATSLSKRVLNWIRSTNPVSEVVNTPRPGVVLGAQLAADKNVRRVGVLEYDMLPFGISDDLAKGAPALEFADATEAFASVRQNLDEAEIALIGKTDELVRQALVAPSPGMEAGAHLGLVEEIVRDGGAEEAYLAVAPDLRTSSKFVRNPGALVLGDCVAVSASAALKGCWVRRTRSFAAGGAAQAAFARAEAWWERGECTPRAGQPIGRQVQAAVARLPGARLKSWMAESCRGSYPLQVIASPLADAPPLAGSLVVLTVELEIDGLNWLAAAPFVIDNI
jgi:Xaa-Pro aminopeptidase